MSQCKLPRKQAPKKEDKLAALKDLDDVPTMADINDTFHHEMHDGTHERIIKETGNDQAKR